MGAPATTPEDVLFEESFYAIEGGQSMVTKKMEAAREKSIKMWSKYKVNDKAAAKKEKAKKAQKEKFKNIAGKATDVKKEKAVKTEASKEASKEASTKEASK